MGEYDDGSVEYIDIVEGTYTDYVDVKEKVIYRFTPTESDVYYFLGRADSDFPCVTLYDSEYNVLVANEEDFDYMESFSISWYLQKGSTYYFEAGFFYSGSGNITSTLKRRTLYDLTGECATNYVGKVETIEYRFVPTETSMYHFYHDSSYSRDASCILYDEEHKAISSDQCSGINYSFKVAHNLEEGKTYYFAVRWQDESTEGDMTVHMAKCSPIDIAEGTYTNFIGLDETVEYRFVPRESGTYAFFGSNRNGPKATLYDADHNKLARSVADDSSEQFNITYELEAGNTYYYVVRLEYEFEAAYVTVSLKRSGKIDIEEGCYTYYVGAGDTVEYRFTPSVSGMYHFYQDYQYSHSASCTLYDENHQELTRDDRSCSLDTFKITWEMEAGKTYYFATRWLDISYAEDMTVRLVRCAAIDIDEGTYTNYVGYDETVEYRFVPQETGIYCFSSNCFDIPCVTLYDSEHHAIIREGNESEDTDFHVTSALKAGNTYYFAVKWWNDIYAADMTTTLARMPAVDIEEGQYSTCVHVGQTVVYRFVPDVNDTYNFYDYSENTSGPYCTLYDEDYNEITHDGGGCSMHFHISWDLEAGKTYYFAFGWPNNHIDELLFVNLVRSGPIDIVEGTHTSYVGYDETVEYRFVPQETSVYSFYGSLDDLPCAILYDSEHNEITRSETDYDLERFVITYGLEAGSTYYFGVKWEFDSEAGDITSTLERHTLFDIEEGTYTNYVDAGQTVVYRFVPTENGTYRFYHCDYESENSYATLYDGEFNKLDSDDGSSSGNFIIQYQLEAGKTYYFATRWRYGNVSEDMMVKLEKWGILDIVEGSYNAHIVCGEAIQYRFTPTESGSYYFYSHTCGCDPYVTLYDSNHNEIANNDDSNLSLQFKLLCTLEAGAVYYFEVYCWEEVSYGEIMVTLEKYLPLAIAEPLEDVSIPYGETYILEVNLCELAQGTELSYEWKRSLDGMEWTTVSCEPMLELLADEQLDQSQFALTIWDDNGAMIECGPITVTVEGLLHILQQPLDAFATDGDVATFAVACDDTEASFQWQCYSSEDDIWQDASEEGNDTDTIYIDVTGELDGQRYRCVIAHQQGFAIVSEEAVLHVIVPVEITNEISDQYVAAGTKAVVTVEATGEGLTYQWYIKNASAKRFSASAVKTPKYSVTMTDSVNGRQIYCVVTDRYGYVAASETVALYKYTPLSITSQPQETWAKSGVKATATVVAEGEGLSYQWYVKNASAKKFSKSSVTKETYSVTMSNAANGRQIYCVITDKIGNSVTSDTVTLHMGTKLAITVQPMDAIAPIGEKVSTTVQAQGDGLTYQWYIKNKTNTKFSKSSVVKETYSTTMSDKANGRQAYCVITDANGNTVTSNTVTLRVPPINITTQPQNASAPMNKTIKVSVVATGEGLTYQWYVKPVGSSKFSKSSIAKATYSVTMTQQRNGNQLYCVITDANGNTVTTDTVTITAK